MPSRSITLSKTTVLPSPPVTPLTRSNHPRHLLKPAAAGGVAALSLLFLLLLLWRKLTRRRTSPPDANLPVRLSYSSLRRSTESFNPKNLLGRGGFGSVYKGSHSSLNSVAIKVMDAGSLQGEREFQNELLFAEKIKKPEMVVTAIGYSRNPRRRRMLLVYDLMQNGNLQDALLHRKCKDLMDWKKRLSIAVDIAKGIEYLHSFDPPIVHGDIKPSNILLDNDFRARIGDFGLARLKEKEPQVEVEINGGLVEDNESLVDESASTLTGFDEFNPGIEQSSVSLNKVDESIPSPEVGEVVSPCNLDNCSSDGMKRIGVENRNLSRKDWWWRQDDGDGGNVPVKDYVMDWIGNEINEERPSWVGTSSDNKKPEKKKSRKRSEWWASMDDDNIVKKDKRRPPREWWKEEFCEELSRKKKNKKVSTFHEDWWPRGEESSIKRKWRNKSRGSRGSVDWWFDGLSGELWKNKHKSFDSDIPKSGGISSTPSMRGTVCYVAPEYGGDMDVSEKCDVYSFGVLLLVLVAGRRPLQVSESPLSEFQRANLISWARHLARAGKLLDLVDQSIESLNQEKALLCITVALICLQKSPARRPSMKEVVGILCGDLQVPQLPVEYSPSPPSRFPFNRQKNV